MLAVALDAACSGRCAGAKSGGRERFAAEDGSPEEKGEENSPEKKPAEELPEAAARIVELTNEFRAERELSSVKVDSTLAETAQYFANFMATEHKYGHSADKQKPGERARSHGYEYCIVSENIAYIYRFQSFSPEEAAERFVANWWKSPEHHENMTDPDVTETGVAVSRGSTGYLFAVQMFGRPKSSRIEVLVENNTASPVQYQSGDEVHTLPPRYRRVHYLCRPGEFQFFAEVTKEPAEAQIIDQARVETATRFVVSGKPGDLEVIQGSLE